MNKIKNNNKKISIIIPVYNTESYVERCLRSVLKQVYDNLEIICVDDGSTDRSGYILDKIANEDNRVHVIHTKRNGVGISRNIAMEEATGDYYGFVDSDDYVSPDMYTILIKAIEENNVDIVTCKYFLDYNGQIEIAANNNKVPDFPMNNTMFLYYVWERDVYKGVSNYLWTKVYKQELIKDDKGKLIDKFEDGFSGTDIVFNAKVCARAKKILYIDIPLYYYSQRSESIVHSLKEQMISLSWIKAYEQILKMYYEQKVHNDIIELVQRMYVYRCGKTLEQAIKYNDMDRIVLLREKIKKLLPVYIKTNKFHTDRIEWISKLL